MSMNQPLFSPRLTKLLLELLTNENFVSTSVLADSINTSKRTLFREISGCDTLLKPYRLSFVSKSGLGLKIEGDTDDKLLLFNILKDMDNSFGYYDIDQRRMLLTAELLKNKSISKLITFAQIFDVSEATISKDLSILDTWFEKYNLRLLRKPGYGIEIAGNEDDVRKAMTEFVHQQLQENKLIDLIYLYQDDFDIQEYFTQQDNSSILSLLNHEILSKVIQVIRNSEFKYVQKMADSSLIGLIIHVTIAIERLLEKEIISMDKALLQQLKSDPDFKNAHVLATSIEKAFHLQFPEDEVAYILMHLKGAKLRDVSDDPHQFKNLDDGLLKKTIQSMIESFEKEMHVPLMNDDVLHKGLLTHLRPALTRMDYKLSIRNPLLKQIKNQYPDIFNASAIAVKAIEETLHQTIPIDEVGYVALHFGAAIERYNQRINETMALKIGVVCASGIGISSLLSSRIKNIFPDLQMVVPMALEDVDKSLDQPLDLLITTIPIEHSSIASVYVHPLLSDEDILNIKKAIDVCKSLKKESYYPTLTTVDEDPLEALAQINLMIQKLRKQFSIRELDSSLSLNAIIDKVSSMCAYDHIQAKEIKQALHAREQYGSVVVDEVKVILLHAKIENLKEPILKMFIANPHPFEDLAIKSNQTVMVMIASKSSKAYTNKMLGIISSSLIDDDAFKTALLNKDKENIASSLSGLLQKWYRSETMQRLKNS